MEINWYPGHMKKTFDELERNIKKIDVVLYVLDSRAWKSSLNPKIDDLVKNKDIVYILNKTDLIDKNSLLNAISYFEKNNKKVLAVQGTDNSCKKIILNKLNIVLRDKIQRSKDKGINPIFKVLVVGTPNTGKSTIINSLNGEKKAKTGDKAGVTKTQQWVKVSDNYVLLDTPGTLWPKMDAKNQELFLKLAFIGAIKKDVVDQTELGYELIKFLIEKNPEVLKTRYGIELIGEPLQIYEEILSKSGCLMKGGNIDYDRGSIKILEDFRNGRMGKISLD